MEVIDVMEYFGLANLIVAFLLWLTVIRYQ